MSDLVGNPEDWFSQEAHLISERGRMAVKDVEGQPLGLLAHKAGTVVSMLALTV